MIIHIIKNKDPYVRIDKRAINDERLSFEARGLLAYLLDKPPAWHIHSEQLARHGNTTLYGIRKILRELKAAGYATRTGKRGADNRPGTRWIVSEKGNLGNPRHKLRAATSVENQQVVKTGALSNNLVQSTNKQMTRKKMFHPMKSGLLDAVEKAALSPKERIVERIVSAFKEYSERHRMHLHKRGATLAGWNEWTISVWRRHCRELLRELKSVKRLETVLHYYIRHAPRDKYVKHCATFITFHAHFHDIERWYVRTEGVELQPAKPQWQVEEE